jgi:hypothetical protein
MSRRRRSGRLRRPVGATLAALLMVAFSWSGREVFGIGAPRSPAPSAGFGVHDGQLLFGVPVSTAAVGPPLVPGPRGRGGAVLGQPSPAQSSLIGAADVLGTGRADLVLETGDEIQVLDADSGVTVFSLGLPARTVVLGLAPLAGAGAPRAGVVLLTPDIGPLGSDDRVTVLAGPVLAPIWTRNVDADGPVVLLQVWQR